MFRCNDCRAEFTPMEQTRGQQRDGICPACGGDRIHTKYGLLQEKQLADLKAMREASRIKG